MAATYFASASEFHAWLERDRDSATVRFARPDPPLARRGADLEPPGPYGVTPFGPSANSFGGSAPSRFFTK
jgi:hypothetical protein